MGSKLKRDRFGEKAIETPDIKLLHYIFPSELMDYFLVSGFYILCKIETKEEFFLIDFEEKNLLPQGHSSIDFESKGFMDSKFIQDFPLRGKAVYLSIRKRRWRHKQTGKIIKRDFSFLADGSKFTLELSDFLKDAGQYANRYHEQHSQLLWDQQSETTTPLQA